MTRPFLTAAVAIFSALALAAPASADGGVEIGYVDSVDGATTLLVSVPPGQSSKELAVTVNGRAVDDAEIDQAKSVQRSTVLVLDTSLSMKGAPQEAALSAARAFLKVAPKDVAVGLVSFDGGVREVVAPTTARREIDDAISTIQLSRGTRLYDAVAAAAKTAGTSGARSLLILSDGRDDGGGRSLDEAVAAAQHTGVRVDAVSMDRGRVSRRALDALASGSGGEVVLADRTSLSSVFAARAARLNNQVAVHFPTPAGVDGSADVTVTLPVAGVAASDATYAPLQAAALPNVPAQARLHSYGGPRLLLGGGAALLLGLLGLVWLVFPRGGAVTAVTTKIDHFTGKPVKASQGDNFGGDRQGLKAAAVGATDKVLSKDLETRVAERLQGAGSSLAAAEWLLIHVGIAVGVGFLGLITGGVVSGMLLLILGAAMPWLWLRRRHSRRRAAFDAQLAETLQLLAGGLSAGLSVSQAIDSVVQEAAEPMAGELRRAMVEQRLGVDLTDALEAMSLRMESQDANWVVMAMRIQREVGGNLSELLLTVAHTLRERDDVKRQVAVLSSEGKMSAWVLSLLPVAMFVYMVVARREAAQLMWQQPLGIAMLVVAGLLVASGVFWMSRMVRIEV